MSLGRSGRSKRLAAFIVGVGLLVGAGGTAAASLGAGGSPAARTAGEPEPPPPVDPTTIDPATAPITSMPGTATSVPPTSMPDTATSVPPTTTTETPQATTPETSTTSVAPPSDSVADEPLLDASPAALPLALPVSPTVSAIIDGYTPKITATPPPGSGTPITSYLIEYSTSPGGPWSTLFSGGPNAAGEATVIFSAADAPTDRYFYRAAASTADGQGPFSVPVTAAIELDCTVSLPVRHGSRIGAECVDLYLWAAKYTTIVDGLMSSDDVAAIRSVQERYSLPVTGAADASTLAAIGIWTEPPAPDCSFSLSVRSWDSWGAECLDDRLVQLGIGATPEGWDYYADEIVQVQRAFGLGATGWADARTLTALGIWLEPEPPDCGVSISLGAPWMPGTKCLERRLKQLGLFLGTPDEFFDADTAEAIWYVQESAAFPGITAYPDASTMDVLGIFAWPPAPGCTVSVPLGAPWMPGNACLERRLAQLGLFWRVPDEIFDWDTAVGVSLFQQSVGWLNTARPDARTLWGLGIWAQPPAPGCSVSVNLGARWMPGTACLEHRLRQLGLFWRTPDEFFDWDTAVGVSLYQQTVGRPGTGSPDLRTLTDLGIWTSPLPNCTVSIGLGAPWMPGNACLERRLAALGLFWRTPDDYFDWDTAVGVSLFQQSYGRPGTGNPDLATMFLLFVWRDPPPPPCTIAVTVMRLSVGTVCIERRLQQLGLFWRPPDGTYDWDTAVAVSLYQQSARLANTATPDIATLSSLRILG